MSVSIFSPTRRSLVILLLCCALISAVSAAAADSWKAPSLLGDLVLVDTPDGYVLELPGGEKATLPLARSAHVTSFRTVGEHWYVAAVDSEVTLRLLADRGQGIDSLPTPQIEGAKMLATPALLTDGQGLRGLAWLEGEAHDRLSVRAATWSGSAWSAAQTVSPPGPGSQLALSAAILDNGSWIAVWSAFDGTDDEISWSSRSRGGVWSAPRPLADDNFVPDITPQVVPIPGGAIAVWSRYDGNDYRVILTRFDGEAWSQARMIGGKGSVFPTLHDEAGTRLLLFRQAVPLAWGVVELDVAGKVLRRAEIATADKRRPIIAGLDEAGVVLEWPGEDAGKHRSVAVWQAP